MKKIVLLFIILFGLTANARFIHIEFNQGAYIQVVNEQSPNINQGFSTTNAEINILLSYYNINNVVSAPDWDTNQIILFIEYNGSAILDLKTELENISTISSVKLCIDNGSFYPTYADKMDIKLFDATDGNPIGVNLNGNITTSNSGLNLIFDIFNVKSMSVIASLYYEIKFDGNITELKSALDNLNTVIEFSFPTEVMLLLNNQTFDKSNTTISPNPFSNNFTIEVKEQILNYSLFDINGKKIISTPSKNEVDVVSSQLNTGMYILNLDLENSKTETHKLIKR